MTEPLHVIIVGGGIAGLCLAQGLRQAGVSVAVHERDRSRTDRLDGYRIHINPAGSRALKACLPPLWDSFVATAGEPGGLGFLTERLRELVIMSGETATDPAQGSHAVDRITLRHLLLSGLDDTVHFGKTFTHYEQHGCKVTALFDDGSSATGDVLVGADGAGSPVRRQFLPHAERVPTEAIGTALRFPLTEQTRSWVPHRLATSMNMIVAPDPFFLFTSVFERRSDSAEPVVTGRQYQSYILCAFVAHRSAYPRNVHDLDRRCLQHVVEAMTVGWHPDLRRLLAESDPGSVALVQHQVSVPVPAWRTINVTLVGDAIHSMPPVGGLGGNAALRDARLLCATLTAVNNGQSPLIPALHRYEAEMHASGYAAVRTALHTQRQGLRSNRAAVAGARTWFRTCRAIPWLRKLNLAYREQARPRPWERYSGQGRSLPVTRTGRIALFCATAPKRYLVG